VEENALKLTTEQRIFLDSVSDFNKRFNAVRMGPSIEKFCHTFWTAAQIAELSAKVQADWEIPNSLVVFYGDMHDVICLEILDGTIKLLDDDRNILFTWASIPEFVQCLRNEPEEPIENSGIIETESWLDF
jgi:hypothetical protein